MTPITKDSILDNGFVLLSQLFDEYEKKICNWRIVITFYKDVQWLEIEADGGDCSFGHFNLSHFTTIEQIDALIYAMKGGALGIDKFNEKRN